MKQRLASIGGQLVIEASSERGTTVRLMVNCSAEHKQKKTATTK
jgi:signal transduction histidine kinase